MSLLIQGCELSQRVYLVFFSSYFIPHMCSLSITDTSHSQATEPWSMPPPSILSLP